MEVETRMAPVETQELPLESLVIGFHWKWCLGVGFRPFFGCELSVSGRVLNLKTWYSKILWKWWFGRSRIDMSSCIMLQLPSVALSVNEHGPVENVFRIEDGGFSSHLRLPEGKPTFFFFLGGGEANHSTGLLQEPTEVAPWQNSLWVMHISVCLFSCWWRMSTSMNLNSHIPAADIDMTPPPSSHQIPHVAETHFVPVGFFEVNTSSMEKTLSAPSRVETRSTFTQASTDPLGASNLWSFGEMTSLWAENSKGAYLPEN